MNKYFLGVKSANELKALFRKLCNELHPDKGGNSTDFINMMDEYNKIKDSFNLDNEAENLKAEELYNILEQLNVLENVQIDFIGSLYGYLTSKRAQCIDKKKLLKTLFLMDTMVQDGQTPKRVGILVQQIIREKAVSLILLKILKINILWNLIKVKEV